MRGPKSRAGLIAYPVVASGDRPIAHTSTPTRKGPSAAAGRAVATLLEKIAAAVSTSTNVPMNSLKRFAPRLGMASIVEKLNYKVSR
jgi:hypothetical protein